MLVFIYRCFLAGPRKKLKSSRNQGPENKITPPISGDFDQCCSINVGQKCLVCPSAVELLKYNKETPFFGIHTQILGM